MKKNYYFEIVDVSICIRIPFEFMITEESIEFISNKQKEDVVIEFIDINEPIKLNDIYKIKNAINVYKKDGNIIKSLYPVAYKNPSAWLVFNTDYYYEIKYLKGKNCFRYSKNILEAIDIENILNKFNAFILHCSFIKYNDKAILFSAPSGTGKSTQAELWNKYEGAEIINGDRAGIRKIDDKWTAYGLPFAGSSRIFKNEKALISHVIILRQGKENKIHRLSPRDAFIKLYSETTIHTWDEDFQKNVIEQITDLVQNIPVYLYECLPDKSAVDYLKGVIGGEDNETKINRA